MEDTSRLIEYAFPLRQASLDSVHEKNVRHGHISTLHIWPARRPLAACRAALIATLLPDPGTPRERQQLRERIGGKLVRKLEKKKMPGGRSVERVKEETEGGVLHWGRETECVDEMEWFRNEIRKAFGGRAPRVLDPFAGGGAIPLEAMRLGCEVTAADINPVAWMVLKCTLEFPQRLACKTRPLPDFILHNDAFMLQFFRKAKGYSPGEAKAALKRLHTFLERREKWDAKPSQQTLAFPEQNDEDEGELEADLAWQVRAWGEWVVSKAREELSRLYPLYAEFEPLIHDKVQFEPQPMRLVPLTETGVPDVLSLNSEYTQVYLDNRKNPRWIPKPTVAYLWARTVICKNCRASIPLLKTRWLCRKGAKRVLLAMEPNAARTGVDFSIERAVPVKGGNAAQRREHDKRLGSGTMSRAGAQCPCCSTIMTGEDIRSETQSGRAGARMTAVIIDGPREKEYRSPTDADVAAATTAGDSLARVFESLPYGDLDEPLPKGASRKGGGSAFTLYLYGTTRWADVFNDRARLSLAVLSSVVRQFATEKPLGDTDWQEAVLGYLACAVDRQVDYNSVICTWDPNGEYITHTFQRFALPIKWDYSETNPLSSSTGNFLGGIDWIARYITHAMIGLRDVPKPRVECGSAIKPQGGKFDVVITDPPYYDAIPYSNLMDIFHVWLRRIVGDLPHAASEVFSSPIGPKWSESESDGELVDDAARFGGDLAKSKDAYEDGMARAFASAHSSLVDDGRMVIVFAHKQPDAWETLVSAIIRAGFIVDASWPIQTEMGNRSRAQTSAALASSVWLVCKKRPASARPGWDNIVLQQMRTNIAEQLREFWDAGIRGPDFVWAATGPAMEAYSRYPLVKKANEPGQVMAVGEFLSHVRRMVVDFVVGQVLTGEDATSDMAAADRLDAPTAYYLLHRHDFGMEEAPAGACILYSTACGISDRDLDAMWNLVSHKGGGSTSNEDDEQEADPDAEPDDDSGSGSGSKLQLKTWAQRKNRLMGYEAPGGQPVPLIDRVHRLMHLWKAGDVHKVDEYLDDNGLRRHELFKRLVQSLIELSPAGSDERKLLESLMNHIQSKGASPHRPALPFGDDE